MSNMRDRTELLEHVLSKMSLAEFKGPEPMPREPPSELLLLAQQAQVISVEVDIGLDLKKLGLEGSIVDEYCKALAPQLAQLHLDASNGLSGLCIRIVSASFADEAHDCRLVIERLISTAQRTYELRVQEIRSHLIQDAEARITGHSENADTLQDRPHDDESDNEDAGIEDPDSDSEEAINIEVSQKDSTKACNLANASHPAILPCFGRNVSQRCCETIP
jgi:hypothetical protein